MNATRRATVPRGSKLAQEREDKAHLLAHFAVLHGSGAALIYTRTGWVLRVVTTHGAMAWPVRDRDLSLFDRVKRVAQNGNNPDAEIPADAVSHRNPRLRTLTEAAWQGTGIASTRPDVGEPG